MPSFSITIFRFFFFICFLPAEIPNGCSSNGKSNCNNYSTITGDYSIHTMSMSSCTNTVPNPPVPDQRNDNDAIHLHSHTKQVRIIIIIIINIEKAVSHRYQRHHRQDLLNLLTQCNATCTCGFINFFFSILFFFVSRFFFLQRSALSEQFTSRHGSEHTDTAQDRSNLCANINSSSLNSDHINNSTSIPTKCFTNNSVNKCVTSKIVLQKYYKLNNNNTSSDFTNNKKIADTTVNASLCDDQLSLNASSNISSENDSNNDSNWFPSKRNSLNLLVAKKFQSHCGNMVAMQEISTNDTNNYSFDDPSEELQYGPGIVSKLRCRYLSLALRQSAAKQRPSLDNLRRTTSLNNLLDEDEEDVDEVDDDSGRDSNGHPNSFDETDKNAWHGNGLNGSNHINIFSKNKLIISNGCDNKTTDITQIKRIRFNDNNHQQQINGIGKPPIAPVLNGKPNETSSRRQSQRGNDSLKRARSVEALMRYDTLAWRRDQMNDSEEYPSSNPIILDELIVTESTMVKTKTAQDITIEDKIQQARERNNTKVPKKLTSFMDETERPPPDLVKQTLLKFEASANRRPRGGLQRYGNGDVASKVATYKSKLSGDIKQPSHTAVTVTSPISPTSPIKKPIIKPRTTSPKPIVLNGTNNAKIIASTNDKTAGVDIHQIRNSLEPRTNSKPATSPTTMTTTTINNVMAYRGPRQESPTTPESPQPRSSIFDISNLTKISTESAVTAYDSPTINQLTHRTECLTISTPKARPYGSQLNGKKIDDIAQNDSDNDDASTSSSTGCTGSYDINVVSGSDSNENDSDSDDKKIVLKKKRVSKMALENISNAGLTTKFAFDSTGSSNVSNQSKSYLPVINNNNINTNVNNSHTIKQTNGSDGITLSPPEPSVRQIGIIRPLINEQKPIVPPIPPVRTVLLPTASNVNSITDTIKVSVMPSSTTIVATQSVIVSPTVPGTASVVLTNNSNTSTDGNNVVIVDCNTKPMPPLRTENLLITTTTTTNVITTTPSMASPMLSPIYQDCTNNSNGNANSIVQQKNQINKEKSIEEINGKTSSLMIQLPMKWNGGNKSSSTIITSTPIVTNQHQSNSSTPSVPQIKNRAQNDTQTNTMVFNFSNRKEVPDYIENDGLVIRRKRELPKVS